MYDIHLDLYKDSSATGDTMCLGIVVVSPCLFVHSYLFRCFSHADNNFYNGMRMLVHLQCWIYLICNTGFISFMFASSGIAIVSFFNRCIFELSANFMQIHLLYSISDLFGKYMQHHQSILICQISITINLQNFNS
jgi:hypothetical protein